MTFSSCRLHPVWVDQTIVSRYLISPLNNTKKNNYKIYKQNIPKNNLIVAPYSLIQLENNYPQSNFTLPICIEFCSGTGEFIIEAAIKNPDSLFIGVEIALPCIQRALSKLKSVELDNLLFYNGDANDFIFFDFINFKFKKIMVNFPDPWPKKKHLKRRIISASFVKACEKKLRNKGELITVTDVSSLYEYHQLIIEENSNLINILNDEHSHPSALYDFPSRYQNKNLSNSKKIYYTKHLKKNE